MKYLSLVNFKTTHAVKKLRFILYFGKALNQLPCWFIIDNEVFFAFSV